MTEAEQIAALKRLVDHCAAIVDRIKDGRLSIDLTGLPWLIDDARAALAAAPAEPATPEQREGGDAASPRPWVLVEEYHKLRLAPEKFQGVTICEWRERKTGAGRGQSPRYIGFDAKDRANAALILAAVNSAPAARRDEGGA